MLIKCMYMLMYYIYVCMYMYVIILIYMYVYIVYYMYYSILYILLVLVDSRLSRVKD